MPAYITLTQHEYAEFKTLCKREGLEASAAYRHIMGIVTQACESVNTEENPYYIYIIEQDAAKLVAKINDRADMGYRVVGKVDFTHTYFCVLMEKQYPLGDR